MPFYTDWLVTERNSSSSRTVLLASCKWAHLHESTPAPSKTSRCIYSFPSAGTKEWLTWWEKTGETFLTSSSCMQTNLTSSLTASSESDSLTEKTVRWPLILWLLINSDSLLDTHSTFCPVLQCPPIFLLSQAFQAAGQQWRPSVGENKPLGQRAHIQTGLDFQNLCVLISLKGQKCCIQSNRHRLLTATWKYHIFNLLHPWLLKYWSVLLFCSSFSGKPIWFSQTDWLARFKGPLFWRPSL